MAMQMDEQGFVRAWRVFVDLTEEAISRKFISPAARDGLSFLKLCMWPPRRTQFEKQQARRLAALAVRPKRRKATPQQKEA